MDGKSAQRIILAAWVGFAGIVTVKHIASGDGGLPPPRLYFPSAVLFTLYYLSAPLLKTFPAVLAVGTDLAVLLNPYIKNSSDAGVVQQVAGLVDTMSGTGAPQNEQGQPANRGNLTLP